MPDLRQLTSRFPLPGRVEAILLRPTRGAPMLAVPSVVALQHRGLEGDRSAASPATQAGGHKRQVTLIQAEHLPLIAAWIGRASVSPAQLRRNLVIAGLNLVAGRALFADQSIRITIGADVVLLATGPCDPCSKMEVELGMGAYNAMRGHGGITALVLVGGRIAVGDEVRLSCGAG